MRAVIERLTALSERKPIQPFQREGRLRAFAKRPKTLRGGPPEGRRRELRRASKPKPKLGPAAALWGTAWRTLKVNA